MSIQEQAVQMIHDLSDDNVAFLVDFMKRFMLPEEAKRKNASVVSPREHADYMQEMEDMRIRAKAYFPSDFDAKKVWEEAMDKKYGSAD